MGTKKGQIRKTARRAYEPKKKKKKYSSRAAYGIFRGKAIYDPKEWDKILRDFDRGRK